MRHRKGTLREDGEEGRRTPTNTRKRRHQEEKNEDMIMTKKIPTAMNINKRNEYAGNHMKKIKIITATHKNEKEKKKKNIYDIEKFNKTNKRLKQLEFRTENEQQQGSNMSINKSLHTREVRTRGTNHLKLVERVKCNRYGRGVGGEGLYPLLSKQEPTEDVRNALELVGSNKNYVSGYVAYLKSAERVKCKRDGLVDGEEGLSSLLSKKDPIEGVRNVLGLAGPIKSYDPG